MTTGRSMTVGDFKKYVRKLQSKLVGADGAIVRGIHSGLARSVAIVQRSVANAMPASPNGSMGAFDTGDYNRRWQFELTPTGGRLFNDHPAADVIEKGRRPGGKMPPTAGIKLWAMRRLGLSEDEAERAKFPIAMAIARRGLTGRHVLGNPMTKDQITRAVLEEIMTEVKAELYGAGP